MKKFLMTALLAGALMVPVAANAATVAEKQNSIQKMESETLDKLYKLNPDAQREIAGAVGTAVFDSGSLALMWISGGYGHGVAHDNRNGADTYMEMATADVLPGVRIYQMTDNGLMAQAMIQGTKYWSDDDLNVTGNQKVNSTYNYNN